MTTTRRTAKATPLDSLESQLDTVSLPEGLRQGLACLVVSTGEAAGTVFQITQPALLIGRSAEAKVRIDEQAISADHALLEVDGSTFTLRDLGSTNGTFVNGQRLDAKRVLSGGDTIQMGSTTFLFVTRESRFPEATAELGALGSSQLVEVRRSRRPPSNAPLLLAPAEEQPASLSLTDVVGIVRHYWGYVRRYGWIVALLTCVGVGGGIAHAQFRPPPGSAWFEMRLSAAPGDDAKSDFLAGVENTFRSLPLIKRALANLGTANVTDASATFAQTRLSFRRTAFNSNVYRGEYDDVSAERAAAFLQQLASVYVDSELDKLLEVLSVDAKFDRTQEDQAKARVAEARGRLVAFSDAHPEAVPKDAQRPEPPVARPGSAPSPERLEQNVAAKERALRAAYIRIQTKKASPILEQAASVDAKISEARSHGLKDQHPELVSLLALQTTLRSKINALLASEPSATEQAADEEVTRLQDELVALRTRKGAAQATASSTSLAAKARNAARGAPRGAPQSLSQLRIDYAELAGEYERAKSEHDALMKKREQTDRQLERERTSAKARYDIITPPTPATQSATTLVAKRAGLGGGLGLALALAIAAGLELRRKLISRGHL